MEGMRKAQEEIFWIIFAIIISMSLLAIGLSKLMTTQKGLCWRTTTDALAGLAGEEARKPGGVSLLNSKSEFSIRLPVQVGCVKKILFSSYKFCYEECDSFDGDKKGCREQCMRCRDTKGCILAMSTPKGILQFRELDDIRQSIAKAEAFATDYYFDSTELGPVREKEKMYCLGFSRYGDTFHIDKKVVGTEDFCGESAGEKK